MNDASTPATAVATRARSLLILIALLWIPLGCRKHYRCEEQPDPRFDCSCSEVSKASEAHPCQRIYDCCVEYANSGFLSDDPKHGGSACVCWNLDPGETCDTVLQQYDRPGISMTQTPSCPPP